MRKKSIYLIPIILLIIMLKIDVYAAGTCTKEEKEILQVEANNLTVSYDLFKEDDERSDVEYYYKIVVNGYTSNLYLTEGITAYDATALNKNGEIVFSKNYDMGEKIYIKVIASSKTGCSGTELTTKVLTLPYYNKYSEREECKNLTEYDICKKNANTTNVSEEMFLKKIDEAKEIEKEKNKKPPVEKEKSTMEKLVLSYTENLTITLPITILIILSIVLVVYKVKKNNKKKIKIDLDKV